MTEELNDRLAARNDLGHMAARAMQKKIDEDMGIGVRIEAKRSRRTKRFNGFIIRNADDRTLMHTTETSDTKEEAEALVHYAIREGTKIVPWTDDLLESVERARSFREQFERKPSWWSRLWPW